MRLRKRFFHGSRNRAVSCALHFALLASIGQGKILAQANQAQYQAQASQESEAESMVSFSASTLTDILRREPGLLLQVKKMLVRKAYEQGRLLDADDLTDDALFRLLREDANIRALVTEEVEKREYVRAKPTRQERDELAIERTNPEKPGTPVEADKTTQSEEEKYWAHHEQVSPRQQIVSSPNSSSEDGSGSGMQPDTRPYRTNPPGESPNPSSPPSDSQRRQDLAGMQPRDQDSFDLPLSQGGSALTRITPDGMPGLLSASMNESRASAQRLGSDGLPSDGALNSANSAASLRAYLPDVGLRDTGASRPDLTSASSFPTVDHGASRNSRMNQFDAKFPRSISSDDNHPVIRHRANPYADVPSLYDLYAQVSKRSPVLARFGEDVFQNGTGNFDELPMDLPVGPDYVLGPGDGLSIELWGGVSQRLQRVVDREGRVALPEAGAIQVTGRTLGDVQTLVQSVLRTEYRDVQADVSLARLRTVRVYIVGDVQRPGAYDVSSLSTPLNALYLAGGPTSRGSLRLLRHYRGDQMLEEIDVYDLLLHGVRSGLQRLQAGDSILVPPLGAEVTVEGMVRRPAIYELNHEGDLAEALELAGGVLNSGTLRHVEVERVVAHESRTMLKMDVPENSNQEAVTQALEEFKIQDGDKIRISPILAYTEKTVYLDGHVFHPGKYAYREGMRITDLIKSFNDLLPEPAQRHAEIIRLNAPDYTPMVIAFNLGNALAGKDQNVLLQPFDTVRIFGRYDFEDLPTVTVSGEVRDPGEHATNGETHVRDAIYLAGGVTHDALMNDAQIFRRTADGKLKVLSVNLEKALAGEAAENVPLEPKDRIFIHRNLSKVDPATVKIEGEVARPGKYPLGEDMSAAELVRLAGGLKRGAFTEAADLTRYTVENGSRVMGEHLAVPIARALAGEVDTDMRLHDGDVLTIRQLSGWADIGSVISVKGEVMHPGEYGIQEGERLSSVLARAGGLRADAYPYGAILERSQLRELAEKTRADLIRRVREEQVSFKLIPDVGDPEDKLSKDATIQQWRATLEQLENTPPQGRLVIHVSRDVRKWANTSADIEVRAGDTLFIPKAPNYVMVNGQVYNPTAVSYRPGKSAGWYLRQGGGPTNMANKKAIVVVRADGSVIGGTGSGAWFMGDVLTAELRPGDMVFVPEKALGGTLVWKNTLQTAQLLSSVAIAVSVLH
jgi:protein involved in polysaccharide export with SLBB domain